MIQLDNNIARGKKFGRTTGSTETQRARYSFIFAQSIVRAER